MIGFLLGVVGGALLFECFWWLLVIVFIAWVVIKIGLAVSWLFAGLASIFSFFF